MRLNEILNPACIKVPLDAADKQLALFELVDLLAGHVGMNQSQTQQLKDAVWQREQTQTTGIGHGIGIPHGKTGSLDTLHMAIGIPSQPIAFNAIDGKPVELVLLLASPVDQIGLHIQALAKVSRMLTDDAFRDAVKQAPDAEVLHRMLLEREADLAGA